MAKSLALQLLILTPLVWAAVQRNLYQMRQDGWKVERKLGQGSFGKVFLVTDPNNQQSALKVCLLPSNPARRDHAMVEVSNLITVSSNAGSDNILTTFDGWTEIYDEASHAFLNDDADSYDFVPDKDRRYEGQEVEVDFRGDWYRAKIVSLPEHGRPEYIVNIDNVGRRKRPAFEGARIHPDNLRAKDEKELLFLRMEFCDMNLADWIEDTNPSDEDRWSVTLQIARGLQYIHDAKMIHRDMKPGNILIQMNKDGRPVAKVCDFGLSTVGERSEGRSGTWDYMAPEQKVRYGRYDNKVDMWACGLIIEDIFRGRSKDWNDARRFRDNLRVEEPSSRWSANKLGYELVMRQSFLEAARNATFQVGDVIELTELGARQTFDGIGEFRLGTPGIVVEGPDGDGDYNIILESRAETDLWFRPEDITLREICISV